jgi:hypothetical protein
MIAVWTLAGMVYAGGLLGVAMAVAEEDLMVFVNDKRPLPMWHLTRAVILFVAWPAAVAAVLVSKALK